MIPALILAGGLGTRLAQTVPHLPKALAPIRETPFLHLLLRQLDRSGVISKVILALGYRSSLILDAKFPDVAIPIESSLESSPLGTGGAILNAIDRIEGDLFMVLNGDSFFDLPLDRFMEFHQSRRASVTIACAEVEDKSRYGSLKMDSTGRIFEFAEKSSCLHSPWINAGVYLMQKRLFAGMPLKPYSLEKDMLPRFVDKQFFGYVYRGTFIDIGTQQSYQVAQETLKPWL